jgi:hypothetical protein
MSRTRYKLAEAAFFLGKLDEHHYDDLRALRVPSDPTYGFYISAFVSASRAVTWVMRSEYSGKPGWEEWYRGQTPASDETELLTAFTALRNRSQKSEPIVPSYSLRVAGDIGPPVDRDPKMPKVRVTFTPVGGGESIGGELMALSWSVPELQGGDLLQACQKYFQALERLVDGCEKTFGVTAQE